MPIDRHHERPSTVEPIRFRATIRYWNPEESGLAVVDVPAEHVATMGGPKQQRVHGTVSDAPFTSNVMPGGRGRWRSASAGR